MCCFMHNNLFWWIYAEYQRFNLKDERCNSISKMRDVRDDTNKKEQSKHSCENWTAKESCVVFLKK